MYCRCLCARRGRSCRRCVWDGGLENFQINAIRRDGNIVLDITGDKLGVVIGRRGETLDSLQYLTILASNRTEESYCRISIDCNGYRDKRRETLESLAKRTSAKVIKQGRKIALEPMNPYERRIIHTTIQEIEGVDSHSIGSESDRRVVITLAEGFKATQPPRNSACRRRAPPAISSSKDTTTRSTSSFLLL